jgi:hypothetical protein
MMSTKTDRCMVCNESEFLIHLSSRHWCRKCEKDFERVKQHLRAAQLLLPLAPPM